MSIGEGVDAGVEAAVRVNQGFCIYAGCFPINVLPPPLSIVADLALTQAAKSFPAIGDGGTLGRHGIVKRRGTLGGLNKNPGLKFNNGTAWIMSDGLGAPFAVGEAADKWFDAADKLSQARSRLEQLTSSLTSDQWSGDDREAFNKELGELAQQIGDAELFATIVGWSLVAGVVPLGAWPLGCSIVGVIQFANASLFYAAVASIVGNLGPSEVIYAEGLATAVACNRSLKIGSYVLLGVLSAAAAGIVGGALINAGQQESHGDEDAWTDLARATVEMTIEQGVKNLAGSGIEALSPWPVDLGNRIANPEDYLGKNNDPIQEGVDDHLGEHAEDAGNKGGDILFGEDKPDSGPYSG
ncbi:hypothetical protein [Nocardioides sp. Root140]|uniref:hypothetical protein n=1 Tax=Nocardioides sp. Root140 TaxID=1736460 RepID=UPI0006FFFD28|nr:hypothetical protein [Nocardioides sp. Root140]KQY57189.1 hypothetical protein ASD30_13175 [Nocardioides sp. Root140]